MILTKILGIQLSWYHYLSCLQMHANLEASKHRHAFSPFGRAESGIKVSAEPSSHWRLWGRTLPASSSFCGSGVPGLEATSLQPLSPPPHMASSSMRLSSPLLSLGRWMGAPPKPAWAHLGPHLSYLYRDPLPNKVMFGIQKNDANKLLYKTEVDSQI